MELQCDSVFLLLKNDVGRSPLEKWSHMQMLNSVPSKLWLGDGT